MYQGEDVGKPEDNDAGDAPPNVLSSIGWLNGVCLTPGGGGNGSLRPLVGRGRFETGGAASEEREASGARDFLLDS
jgi:hypothetical protein